jgi:transposase
LLPRSDTEDSEQIEIEVRAYRRLIRRRRYQRTCTCQGGRTLTAPPLPKLIPKGRYGISVWVEILLDKYFRGYPGKIA